MYGNGIISYPRKSMKRLLPGSSKHSCKGAEVPMKESSPPGHVGVAAAPPERTTRGTRRQQQQQQQQQHATSARNSSPVLLNTNINNNNDPVSKNNNHHHGGTTTTSTLTPPTLSAVVTTNHSLSTAAVAPTTDNDSDSEGDWDVGVGNLVIDLDADLERHHSATTAGGSSSSSIGGSSSGKPPPVVAALTSLPPAVGLSSSSSGVPLPQVSSASSGVTSAASSAVAATAGASSRATSGKMSSVEHHAVVDKGLKMKIKRKNVGSKSDIKHEIVKDGSKGQGSSAGGNSSGQGGPPGNSTNSANSDGGSGTNSNSSSSTGNNSTNSNNMPGSVPSSPMDNAKQKHGADSQGATGGVKEKSAKGRGAHKKDKGRNANNKNSEAVSNGTQFHAASGSTSGGGAGSSSGATGAGGGAIGGAGGSTSTGTIPTSLAHKFTGNVSVDLYPIQTPFNIKKETPADDPYEFNAKVEDGGRPLGFPVKKIKAESGPTPMVTGTSPTPTQGTQDVAVETCTASTITDPDCLGPCEPGTAVTLEGIVWQETENGVLVVNVTWRGKTYVGTLLDATKHDWAPPRLNCDSPTSEVDVRTPKGRGKRGRAAANVPDNLEGTRKLRKGRRNNSGTFTAPPSPAKSDASSQGVKRKGKVADLDLSTDGPKASKRCRSSSRGTPTGNGPAASSTGPGASSSAAGGNGADSSSAPALIECPEPNCNKKYKHINGLRYHQTHAHQNTGSSCSNGNNAAAGGDEEGEDTTKDPPSSEESGPHSPAASSKSDKATTRSKSKKAAAAAAKNSMEVDGDDTASTASPRKQKSSEDSSTNGAGSSSNSNSNVANMSNSKSAQGQEGKQGKADRKDGEGHSGNKKSDTSNSKSANVPIAASNSNSNSAGEDSCKTSSSSAQMFQISGAPIGCLATSGVMAPPVSSNPIIVSTGGATTVTTQLIGGTAVTTMPVSLPTGTTIVSLQQTLDAKADSSSNGSGVGSEKQQGKKAKGDKTDKTKGKSAVATRPIMPAPATLPVGHGQMSSGNQHGLMSQNSALTAGLKPIQPKPTIMGEPSINPALATLAKEKKPKKKKSRDKDQVNSGQQHSPPQQHQQQQSQGKGTPNKDVMFIKQEDAKSVIKTVPSPLKPVGEAGDPRLRDPASLPPELSKQPPVGAPGTPQRSDLSTSATSGPNKGEITTSSNNSLSPNSSNKASGGGDQQQQQQRFARPPSSLSINSPLQVSTESSRGERSGEVQSPAYSDISDESAPTLENETTNAATGQQQQQQQRHPQQQSSSSKGKEDVADIKDKGMVDGRGPPGPPHQADDPMAAYSIYSYYPQPPFLIPAVSAAQQGSRSSPIKSASAAASNEKELDLSGKSSAARKEADRDSSAAKMGGEGNSKDGASIKNCPSEDNSKGGGSQPPLTDYQLQQQQQQKLMQHQLYYGAHTGYYGGYVDPNYMRLVNEGVYTAQLQQHGDGKHPDDQLKPKEATDLSKDKMMADKLKAEQQQRAMSSHPSSASMLSPQAGKMPGDRSSSVESSKSLMSPSSTSGSSSSSSKPPALISEKERKLRELEHRAAAAKDASLKEKQNENHQILKENIALKSQMAAEGGRHHKSSSSASGAPPPPGPPQGSGAPPGSAAPGQFDRENNGLKERHRDDLQRYYMYQEQRIKEQQQRVADEERRLYYGGLDPYAQHPVHAQAQAQGGAPGPGHPLAGMPQHRGRSTVVTPPGGPRDHRDSPGGKSSHHGKDDGSRSSRDSSLDSRPPPGSLKEDKHGVDLKHKDGGAADDKRNASPSPRTTTPKSSKEGGMPMTSMPHGFPAQYLPHAYLQSPHYAQQIAFDPNHPMYRGQVAAMYGQPAYLHPSMRYHMSPGLDDGGPGSDKAKLLSPSAVGAPPDLRKGGPPGAVPPPPGDHPGKALELLQQHASHYNNFGGGQHKIHELQELGKGGGAADSRASPSKGSPHADLGPSSGGSSSASSSATSAARDKMREVSKSPPPQRHLHTHHHTHVVGPPAYPLYDPYSAAIMTQAAAGPAAPINHPFVPK